MPCDVTMQNSPVKLKLEIHQSKSEKQVTQIMLQMHREIEAIGIATDGQKKMFEDKQIVS